LHGLHRGGEVVGGGIAKGIYLGVSTYQSTDYAKKVWFALLAYVLWPLITNQSYKQKAEEEKKKERLGEKKVKKDNAVVAVASSTVAAGGSI